MNTEEQNINCLIIDWGTTNFRVFAVNGDGQVVTQKALPMGLLQVKPGEFALSLENVLSQWLEGYQTLPVFMAGMVGSQLGWINVDYVPTEVDLTQLSNKAHQFSLPWGAMATIIPGVCHQTSTGAFDVMRGEEVQVFGLAKLLKQTEPNKDSFTAILPGTHSKHISFNGGKMSEFASYMTGELFSVISQQTILGRGLPAQTDDQVTFLKGVAEGQTDKLTSVIFSARTHKLFNLISENHVFDYLSGLLIGYELKNISDKTVYLVGGSNLSLRYQAACKALSINAVIVNGDDCFLAGMTDLIQELA